MATTPKLRGPSGPPTKDQMAHTMPKGKMPGPMAMKAPAQRPTPKSKGPVGTPVPGKGVSAKKPAPKPGSSRVR